MNAKSETKHEYTIDWIILTHTETPLCTSFSTCIARMKNLQSFDINTKEYFDILANFLLAAMVRILNINEIIYAK